MRAVVRKILAALLLCAGLPAVAVAGTVLVIGGSISAGDGVPPAKVWVNTLAAKVTAAGYAQTVVVNGSAKGDTTAGGLSRLPSLLRQHQPVIVVIELGEGDAPRGLTLKATRQNLVKMVRLARQSGARVLLVAADAPKKFGPKYAKEFRAVFPQIARDAGASLQPDFLGGVRNDPDMMQADGVHPNSLAQTKLAENVWAVLAPMLKSAH